MIYFFFYFFNQLLKFIVMRKIVFIFFLVKLGKVLIKKKIIVLQINIGRCCNFVCIYCYVEVSLKRIEEFSKEICE